MGWEPAKSPKIWKKWERLVAKVQAGAQVKDVAKAHGVSPISLSRWNKHLRTNPKRPKTKPASEVAILEVLVEADQTAPGFIVDLRTGHRVHVDSRFVEDSLRRLVRALSAP
jgi:transposase-like protein